MPPTLSDVQVMLDEVARFARERVADAAVRPEHPMGDVMLDALSRDAAELGILPSADGADGDEGLGLWSAPIDTASVAFSTGALTHIARANAGVAFAWHRAALARCVATACGITPPAAGALDLTIGPTGHYGLARGALARWLRTTPLHEGDTPLLADWVDRSGHATTIIAPRAWSLMLWPVWRDGQMTWQLTRRAALDVHSCRPQLGLDELAAFRARATDMPAQTWTTDEPRARSVLGTALALDWLGLLAIGHGLLEHGQALATAFAGMRRQGGTLIAEHAAVQRMLSDIEVARIQSQAALAQLTRDAQCLHAGAAAAARAALHPALCHAANQVVQVHGGIGYMRDAGPEKLLRDQQMLALQGGGVQAAHLFVAAWAEGGT